MIRLALGGQPKMATQSSDRVNYLLWELTLCLVAHIYNFTKFGGFHKAQSGNMCKVDHQALSYVKVLSEIHLLFVKLFSIRTHLLSGVGIILTLIGNFITDIRFSISSPCN